LLYGLMAVPAVAGAALDWNMWATFALIAACGGAVRLALWRLGRDIEQQPERQYWFLASAAFGLSFAGGGVPRPSLPAARLHGGLARPGRRVGSLAAQVG
jgi:hypothetical protein